MQYFLLFVLVSAMVQLSVAPPVNQKSKEGEDDSQNKIENLEDMANIMEYQRYLVEVIQVLESDPEFSAKLEKVDVADIRTGKIADELQFVNHNVRTRLDELKREELERLRHLATKENELKNGLDIDHLKVAEHIDHTNTRTFEIQDLKKLIAKITKDLVEADKKRREEFKQHEMEEKFKEMEKLKSMNDGERKKYEEELEALKEKHKKHVPVHHPGSKQQLEEVWEKQDHMDSEDFNPRTFFFLHDVDGNGVWDHDEVKALFLKELDKLYAQGVSYVDLFKRTEEMERMREHVFNESDLNKDGLISYEEFLEQTKKPDFQQDEGWQGLDEQQIYTQEEFEEFERQKQEMISKGMFPAQYAQHPIPPQEYLDLRGPNQNLPHQQQFQGQNHPQYQQQPPVMIPQQQYPSHLPVQPEHGQIPQQNHPNLQYQQYQGQVPLNQQYQQVPPYQVPGQQLHSGSVPVPQQQGQAPIHQQGQAPVHQQGQLPVQQQPGQLPVQQQGHVPVQHQQAQVPAQNQPQALNSQQQQNTVNQVPESVQSNAAPLSNNPSQTNSQPAKAEAQPDVNRNNIETGGKV